MAARLISPARWAPVRANEKTSMRSMRTELRSLCPGAGFCWRVLFACSFQYTRTMPPGIVLASSSPYRQELLARLRLPFAVEVPMVDEAPLAGESHVQTAQRLALRKAQAAARRHATGAIIIGADQVAELDGRAIGKPGTHEAATRQLRAMSGRTVLFHSAIAVLDTRGLAAAGAGGGDGSGDNDSGGGGRHGASAERALEACVSTEVRFRVLAPAAIEAYLRLDQPYDCAGSAKIESLGICLVEAVHSDDPTALVGLPLI